MNFKVDNIRCSGCANTITKKLKKEFNVDTVDVDTKEGIIVMDISDDRSDEVYKTLLDLGYPKSGESNGIFTKAKSFTSCAIGKVS
jgi:copper chaperone CopZ